MEPKKQDGQVATSLTPRTSAIQSQVQGMLLTTTDILDAHEIVEVKGIVFGRTIRSRGALGRFLATLQGIIGGRTTAYISELEKAQKEAMAEALSKAQEMGANALIGIDFDFSEVMESFIMFSVSGTACVVKKRCRHLPEEFCENCKPGGSP